MLFSYGFEQKFKIYFDWFAPLKAVSGLVFLGGLYEERPLVNVAS